MRALLAAGAWPARNPGRNIADLKATSSSSKPPAVAALGCQGRNIDHQDTKITKKRKIRREAPRILLLSLFVSW